MMMPSAIAKQSQILAAIHAVERELKRDVVHIRYEIAQNWSGDWAVFFRVLLTDDAGYNRLRDVASRVERSLARRLNFQAMGVLAYHNFRIESEQEVLQDAAWA